VDFAAFYEHNRDGCLSAVYASVGDWQVSEELVSESFARAWVSWRRVSRHPAPASWIVRTALNTHVSWWRRRRREVPWDAHDASIQGEPSTRIDADLAAALRALPTRQREVVVYRVFLDLDTRATAQALGIAPGTVTTHLHRALTTLRAQLTPITALVQQEEEP
jgi:RNA polymerase sigma factor (sigma-70 family)